MTGAVRSESRDVPGFPVRRLPAMGSIRATNVQTLLSQIVFVVLLTRSFSDPIFGLSGTDLGGSNIGVGALMNALVIAIAILLVVANPRTISAAVLVMWAPFLLAVFGATLYAPQFASAVRLSFVILTYWAMFTLPFFMLRSTDDLPRLVLVIFASSIGPALYAFWDLRHGLSDSEFRLQSTFTHPNIFAFYLVLLLGLALYVRASSAIRWPAGTRRLIALYVPVLLAFLALTQTRSAWAAFALMLFGYALLVERRFLVIVLLVPLLLSAHSIVGSRLADLSQTQEIDDYKQLNENVRLNSFAWRKVLWTSAIEPTLQTPILGHGLDSFRPSMPKFFPIHTEVGLDAHNWYVQMLFEMGLVGFLAYVWLQVTVLRWLKRGFGLDRNGIVVVAGLVGCYLLESYSDNMIYYLAFNWYYWFTIGMFCAWIECRRAHPERPRATAGRAGLRGRLRNAGAN